MPGLLNDSTALLADPAALRAQGDRDGHLYFRGLLPPEDLWPVRRDLLGVVDAHGWLARTSDPLAGGCRTEALAQVPEADMRTDIGVSAAAYDDVQRLESVHRLPHHPRLIALFETLFGAEVLVHPRHIVRLISPHPAVHPTPPHQDYPLIQGSAEFWTCWIPVGDCPRALGGLQVLRGSHRLGVLPVRRALGAGQIAAQTCPGEELDEDWMEVDYRAGDVLVFRSRTIHRALPCTVPDRFRLSFDVRYQPAHLPVEEKSLLPHCGLQWEEIYADWESDDLKWYWRRLDLAPAAWDPDLLQPARRIC